jgi:hypothetical protein
MKTKYFAKDMNKWALCNAFIGYGSVGSSTEYYRTEVWPSLGKVNGDFKEGDLIGISVNGSRPKRINPPWHIIDEAIEVGGVGFITDVKKDRNRSYNIGEREVAAYLECRGFYEIADGLWTEQ